MNRLPPGKRDPHPRMGCLQAKGIPIHEWEYRKHVRIYSGTLSCAFASPIFASVNGQYNTTGSEQKTHGYNTLQHNTA